MSWIKLDDGLPEHPKIAAVGGDAAWLYVAGLCYCSRLLTDGRIPAAIVPRLTDRRNASRLADALCQAGLWTRDGDAFLVHDYLSHQESAESVRAKRSATAERVTRWREKRRAERVGNADGNAVTGGVSNAVSNAPVTLLRDRDRDRELKDLSPPAEPVPTSTPLALDAPPPEPPKRPRKRSEAPPLPFTCAAASEAVAAAAAGRYTHCPVGQAYTPGIGALIRRYPDLASFAALGRYLAAGGAQWPADKAPSWLASNRGAEAMALAVSGPAPAATPNGSRPHHRPGVAPVADFSDVKVTRDEKL